VRGAIFSAYVGLVRIQAKVRPNGQGGTPVDLTNWAVGYVQKIVASSEKAVYNDCEVTFRYR
jgi:hypothetical protein